MKTYKNRYIQSILITLLTVLFISCSDNSVVNKGPQLPIAIINDPMRPQIGYNAQNTSSPFNLITKINLELPISLEGVLR